MTMRFSNGRQRWGAYSLILAVMASANLVLPLHLFGQNVPVREPGLTNPGAAVVDIALGPNGQLAGQVVDATGAVQTQQDVVIVTSSGQVVARTKSDDQGRFAVPRLRGGVYQVATSQGMQLCRCWTAQTAPPAASQQVLLVSDDSLERGQRPVGKFLTHPIMLGLIIAAAIAIPIAVHNSKDGS